MQFPLKQPAITNTSTSNIRNAFLDFFRRNGFHVAPSASLLPPDGDSTLLFTNAGMVPYKKVFLGKEIPLSSKITSSQRCLRVGGKHNDLDQVGLTSRHHTLFEMLGNFSFDSKYFKEETIHSAWNFLTQELCLPKHRLGVTVLEGDKETALLWQKIANLKSHQISYCDEKENFWSMGDTGPCGPCSEIFWDRGENQNNDERFLEIWNLVFMEYDRNPLGELNPLPMRCVDTGMGLERIASVIQQVDSNFEIDIFRVIIDSILQLISKKRGKQLTIESLPPRDQQAIRVIADHSRAAFSLMTEGVCVSNAGSGYILRKILRRAMRFSHQLQQETSSEPFLSKLFPSVMQSFDSSYPQLELCRDKIITMVDNEEKQFLSILCNGMNQLDYLLHKTSSTGKVKEFPAEHAFHLYDSLGFPLDLTQMIVREKGYHLDSNQVEILMKEQQNRSKASHQSKIQLEQRHDTFQTSIDKEIRRWQKIYQIYPEFSGYDRLEETQAQVKGFVSLDSDASQIILTIDPCPFYAESGGQVSDLGVVEWMNKKRENVSCKVLKVLKPYEKGLALQIQVPVGHKDDISSLTHVCARVDSLHRDRCTVHHSATHLLQTALSKVLNTRVEQSGSFVSAEKLRFDFPYHQPLSVIQLQQIESLLNEWSIKDFSVNTEEMDIDQAKASGALCHFSDRYGDLVRVVSIGKVSKELCGGTHVTSSAQIYPFKILHQSSVAAGIRRIEVAIAGRVAIEKLQSQCNLLDDIAQDLNQPLSKIQTHIQKLQLQLKSTSRFNEQMMHLLVQTPSSPVHQGFFASSTEYQLHHLALDSTSQSSKLIRLRLEHLSRQHPQAIHFLHTRDSLSCILSSNSQHHAGKILKPILEELNGSGGGNARYAQGKLGTDIELEQIVKVVSSK